MAENRSVSTTTLLDTMHPSNGETGCPSLLQIQMRSLLIHTYWPPLLWYFYLTSSLVPIRYAIHGQKERPREEMLVRDEKTGVAYPNEQATRTDRSWWSINVEHHRAVMLLYTVVVLGGSFRLE